MTSFDDEISATRAHTDGYATDPTHRSRWLGFTEQSRNFRAQQLRCFGKLVGGATQSLADWQILDVGCGDGSWLRTFLQLDAKPQNLKGIDVSDVRFDIGRARNPLIALSATDGTTIPFADGQFDLVTQFVCFSCIPTQRLRARVASEIRRCIRRGGFVFWWDLLAVVSTNDPGASLQPSDYFDWPIESLDVGPMPQPSECLRPRRGVSRLLGPLIDLLGYGPTHTAALIGPKP
jgi:SAM-dependent methyltransferase